MEKINIAEILKDCPKGMELDCTMYENVEFDYIEQSPESRYPIHCLMKTNDGYNTMVFTDNGCNDIHPNAKCVIFPKGKTTWEGFQRPFKDGDILTNKIGSVFIYKGPMYYNKQLTDFYCAYRISDKAFVPKLFKDKHFGDTLECRFAFDKEKLKLFDIIKENGYKWNAETKTLEKLIVPKFKVGDRIKLNNSRLIYTITDLLDDRYKATVDSNDLYVIEFEHQDAYKLVPNKFDITTLVPFESRVLVRDCESEKWSPAIWGFESDDIDYPYEVVSGNVFAQCIPFEGNQHLLGTTDDCDDFYKTWE
jgi:hypothetical protein